MATIEFSSDIQRLMGDLGRWDRKIKDLGRRLEGCRLDGDELDDATAAAAAGINVHEGERSAKDMAKEPSPHHPERHYHALSPECPPYRYSSQKGWLKRDGPASIFREGRSSGYVRRRSGQATGVSSVPPPSFGELADALSSPLLPPHRPLLEQGPATQQPLQEEEEELYGGISSSRRQSSYALSDSRGSVSESAANIMMVDGGGGRGDGGYCRRASIASGVYSRGTRESRGSIAASGGVGSSVGVSCGGTSGRRVSISTDVFGDERRRGSSMAETVHIVDGQMATCGSRRASLSSGVTRRSVHSDRSILAQANQPVGTDDAAAREAARSGRTMPRTSFSSRRLSGGSTARRNSTISSSSIGGSRRTSNVAYGWKESMTRSGHTQRSSQALGDTALIHSDEEEEEELPPELEHLLQAAVAAASSTYSSRQESCNPDVAATTRMRSRNGDRARPLGTSAGATSRRTRPATAAVSKTVARSKGTLKPSSTASKLKAASQDREKEEEDMTRDLKRLRRLMGELLRAEAENYDTSNKAQMEVLDRFLTPELLEISKPTEHGKRQLALAPRMRLTDAQSRRLIVSLEKEVKKLQDKYGDALAKAQHRGMLLAHTRSRAEQASRASVRQLCASALRLDYLVSENIELRGRVSELRRYTGRLERFVLRRLARASPPPPQIDETQAPEALANGSQPIMHAAAPAPAAAMVDDHGTYHDDLFEADVEDGMGAMNVGRRPDEETGGPSVESLSVSPSFSSPSSSISIGPTNFDETASRRSRALASLASRVTTATH